MVGLTSNARVEVDAYAAASRLPRQKLRPRGSDLRALLPIVPSLWVISSWLVHVIIDCGSSSLLALRLRFQCLSTFNDEPRLPWQAIFTALSVLSGDPDSREVSATSKMTTANFSVSSLFRIHFR